jgi:hypothetical protein
MDDENQDILSEEIEFHQQYWINLVPYKPIIIQQPNNMEEIDFIEENTRKKIKFKKKSKKSKKSKKKHQNN